ncbi:MAG: hypothetical protein PHF29_08775 [Candidatus Riflebacteria bacterium]|nr:hypothetical protein [Candidatus Riflebacteria bacterium]
MRRKGSAIMMAIILGSVFFIAVSGLLRHSSSEMKHIKAVSSVKKAELLAMSGIDWAESQLRIGRWYGKDFVPYEKNIGEYNTFGVKDLTPFGSGEGDVKIVCEDVANKVPGENMYGMQKIWFLHHINVYALGEYENQRCLIYGRYIISPEPILNSKSTDGAGYASPEHGIPGAVGVSVAKSTVNGEEISDYVVKEVKVSQYDNVDVNTVVAILNPLNDPDTNIQLRPSTYGIIAEVKLSVGQTCRAGDNAMILTKSIDTGSYGTATMKTLKKMVRVTKIPLEIWNDLDIEDRNDRYTLSQYINGISGDYLQNFVAHAALEDALEDIGDSKLDKKLNPQKILNKLPAHITNTTRNRAENTFLAYMIKNFTAPGGTWDKKEKALEKTFLKLDHPKTTKPPKELVDWLSDLGLSHVLNTKPRRDSRYFDPKMKKDEFLHLLNPKFNQPPDKFIQDLSQLNDASRLIRIEEGDFGSSPVYNEDENGITIVNPDKGVKVTVEKVTKKYSFVDPESGFAIEMQDLMSFIKKYYDDDGSQSPREDVRTNEHIDWPLPKPAPPAPTPRQGGTWVWNPGTPGTPPGDPTWTYKDGTKHEVDHPVGDSRDFEPQTSNPDAGRKDYEVNGEDAVEKTDGGENEESKDDSWATGRCRTTGCKSTKGDIQLDKGGKWSGEAGKPGVDPSQGSYVWVADPPAPEPGSKGNDGSDGEESGGADKEGSGTGGSPGGSGTPGGNTGNPGGGSTGPSAPPSPPPAPPRSAYGAC